MNNFIVFEGICCSGKTTICKILSEKISELGYQPVYNHGAMTYTEIGKEFKKIIETKDMPISVLYFFTDLIINTQNIIKPYIARENTIVLQDRYYDAITTYINAYGEYTNIDYNVYQISAVLVENGVLIKPSLNIFCIPPYETIIERMEKSKDSPVHDYYRKNPKFLKMVYNELEKKAKECTNSIIIDTSSELSINNSIEKILTLLKNDNEGMNYNH